MTDPFAPPGSDLLSKGRVSLSKGGVVRREKVDIGAALRYPFQNPDWPTNSLIAGLLGILVPVAGFLALFGWQKRLAAVVASGNESDPPDALRFGEDLSAGVQPFLAFFLNMFAVVMLIVVLGGGIIGVSVAIGAGIEGATDGSGIGGLLSLLGIVLGYGLILICSLGLNLLMPELMRRIMRGEWTPFLSFGRSIAVMRRYPGPLLMTVLGMFVANMIATLGAFACYVGMFVTVPLAQVMLGHLYGQWAAVVGDDGGEDSF